MCLNLLNQSVTLNRARRKYLPHTKYKLPPKYLPTKNTRPQNPANKKYPPPKSCQLQQKNTHLKTHPLQKKPNIGTPVFHSRNGQLQSSKTLSYPNYMLGRDKKVAVSISRVSGWENPPGREWEVFCRALVVMIMMLCTFLSYNLSSIQRVVCMGVYTGT